MKNKQLLASALASIKTVRKNLGGVTLIGQSANDLGENADSIVNSCTSFLFLPDATFNRKHYGELFKLTDQQLDLFESLQEREGLYVRRDGLTKVVILNLDTRSYAKFSTKPKDRVRRTKLTEMYGLTEGIERFAQGETANRCAHHSTTRKLYEDPLNPVDKFRSCGWRSHNQPRGNNPRRPTHPVTQRTANSRTQRDRDAATHSRRSAAINPHLASGRGKGRNCFRWGYRSWVFDGGHVASRFISIKPKVANTTTDVHIVSDHGNEYTLQLRSIERRRSSF